MLCSDTSIDAAVRNRDPSPSLLSIDPPGAWQVMIDPVVCEDGHSYERGGIEAWLRNHDTSPMSNAHLNSKMVVPNHALRNSIEAFRRERGY